jgi:hypothetical protein
MRLDWTPDGVNWYQMTAPGPGFSTTQVNLYSEWTPVDEDARAAGDIMFRSVVLGPASTVFLVNICGIFYR